MPPHPKVTESTLPDDAAAHKIAARAAFNAGVRDTVTIVPSYLPFAMVCGVASVNVGMDTAAALAMPALVFGGSSQAVVAQFLQNSASLWVAVLSGCVINLRMAVYSAALAPRLRNVALWQRMAAAFFLVDNTFAFIQRRHDADPDDPHLMAYYAGLSVMVWPFWVLFCAIGIFAGNIVPASWQLEFTIPLSFVAVMSGTVRNAPTAVSGLVGGVASLVLFDLPLKLGLIAACAIGLLGGLVAERFNPKDTAP